MTVISLLKFLAAAILVTPGTTLSLQSSRILDADESAMGDLLSERPRRVGDGPGRPLYDIGTVELPEDNTQAFNSSCVALRMDTISRSLWVQPIPFDTGAVANDDIASACFVDLLNTTGWNHLNITTSALESMPLPVRVFGAGFLEGVMTYNQVSAFNKSVGHLLRKDAASVGHNVMAAVDRSVRMSLIAWEELTGGDASTEPHQDIARQAWTAFLQLRGIRDGHNYVARARKQPTVSMYELMLMNMHSELPALVDLYSRSEQAKILSSLLQTSAVTSRLTSFGKPVDHIDDDKKNRKDWKTTESIEGDDNSDHRHINDDEHDDHIEDNNGVHLGRTVSWARWSSHAPKGSAIVRRVGPQHRAEDIVAGHVGFGNYGEMLRIMKTYKMNLSTPVGKVIMSSYPACISSTDDYFITDRGLVLMSTNLWLPDKGDFARPPKTHEGLPSFLRSIMATRIADHPRAWAATYNFLTGIAGGKQWLIVDYTNFKGYEPIPAGTAYLAETLPSLTRFGDISASLHENGFFQVHGMPHFRHIRKLYGLPGDAPGYYQEHVESALLDQAHTIDSLAMARSILSEAESPRTPRGVKKNHIGAEQTPINPRIDYSERPIPEGGIDAKVTSRCLVKDVSFQALSGPPANGKVAPFDWKDWSHTDWPHYGLPEKWNFTWVNAAGVGITPLAGDEHEFCGHPDIE
jgi:hypothetical protein